MKKILIITILFIGLTSFINQEKEYPTPPKTTELLFYVQRNLNTNTVIFDAVFDGNGNLDEDKPIDVYWIRYDEEGQRKELNSLERWFAFGAKAKKVAGKENQYSIKLAADKKKYFLLKQTAPFKASVYTEIKGEMHIINNLYVFADTSSFWPKVKYFELFGIDETSDDTIYEKKLI